MYAIVGSCHACGTFFCLLANTLARTRTIPNSKDRELQCSSDIFTSVSKWRLFTERSNIYFTQFRWIFKELYRFSYEKYVVSHSGLSGVLNECIFLSVMTRKPQNLDRANFYNIVEYKQGQVKGLTVWLFN
jgi:hypothetical protein